MFEYGISNSDIGTTTYIAIFYSTTTTTNISMIILKDTITCISIYTGYR